MHNLELVMQKKRNKYVAPIKLNRNRNPVIRTSTEQSRFRVTYSPSVYSISI